MAKKGAKEIKKVAKKTANGKQVCGQCVFYIENQDKKAVGSCLQVLGVVKEKQAPACKGKFFKQKLK
jgi:hypothetical protein